MPDPRRPPPAIWRAFRAFWGAVSAVAWRALWRHPARSGVVAALVVTVVAIAAGVASSARALPDLDLAGGAFDRPPAAAKVSVATTTKSPTGPGGPVARRGAVAPKWPDGLAPVTGTVTVGSLVRTYQVFAPPAGTTATPKVPAIVVLHGRTTSLGLEESRDGLVQLAAKGKAILVYPAGYLQSWNAGACCGPAQAAGVDDLAFLTGLIRAIGAQPNVSTVYLVGYSNGGRMAYDIVCSQPRLVSSFVVVAAVPVVTCPAGAPVSLLELVGNLDPILTYGDGPNHQHVNGYTEPSVTGAVAAWRKRDGCAGAHSTQTTSTFKLQTWAHCDGGSVVALGTYVGAGHAWPAGLSGTPSAGDVLWRFLTQPRATTPVPASTDSPTGRPSSAPSATATVVSGPQNAPSAGARVLR